MIASLALHVVAVALFVKVSAEPPAGGLEVIAVELWGSPGRSEAGQQPRAPRPAALRTRPRLSGSTVSASAKIAPVAASTLPAISSQPPVPPPEPNTDALSPAPDHSAPRPAVRPLVEAALEDFSSLSAGPWEVATPLGKDGPPPLPETVAVGPAGAGHVAGRPVEDHGQPIPVEGLRAVEPVPAIPGPDPVMQAMERPPAVERAPAGRPTVQPQPEAPTPEAGSRLVAGAAGRPSGSLLGLGLGKLRIEVDGGRFRATAREAEVISGRIVSGSAQRVTVRTGETIRDSIVDGGAFTTVVALKPGANAVHVTATDAQGASTEEIVTFQYTPPVEAHGITITSPRDGQTVTTQDAPIVVVEGQVTDRNVPAVRLLANDHVTVVPVADGRFRTAVPLLASTLLLRALADLDGRRYESAPITVHASGGSVADALLVLEWPGEVAGRSPRVVATWRSSPGRLDIAPQPVTLHTVAAVNGSRPDVLYFRNPKPGVYTFTLSHDTTAADGSVRATIYVPEAGRLAPRPLRPVSLNGGGKVVLARLLLPYGVLWEQDDWFTGRSMTADGVTKFRLPEGVTWTERKAALER